MKGIAKAAGAAILKGRELDIVTSLLSWARHVVVSAAFRVAAS